MNCEIVHGVAEAGVLIYNVSSLLGNLRNCIALKLIQIYNTSAKKDKTPLVT